MGLCSFGYFLNQEYIIYCMSHAFSPHARQMISVGSYYFQVHSVLQAISLIPSLDWHFLSKSSILQRPAKHTLTSSRLLITTFCWSLPYVIRLYPPFPSKHNSCSPASAPLHGYIVSCLSG